MDTYDGNGFQEIDLGGSNDKDDKMNKSGFFQDDFFSRGMQRLRLNT